MLFSIIISVMFTIKEKMNSVQNKQCEVYQYDGSSVTLYDTFKLCYSSQGKLFDSII